MWLSGGSRRPARPNLQLWHPLYAGHNSRAQLGHNPGQTASCSLAGRDTGALSSHPSSGGICDARCMNERARYHHSVLVHGSERRPACCLLSLDRDGHQSTQANLLLVANEGRQGYPTHRHGGSAGRLRIRPCLSAGRPLGEHILESRTSQSAQLDAKPRLRDLSRFAPGKSGGKSRLEASELVMRDGGGR